MNSVPATREAYTGQHSERNLGESDFPASSITTPVTASDPNVGKAALATLVAGHLDTPPSSPYWNDVLRLRGSTEWNTIAQGGDIPDKTLADPAVQSVLRSRTHQVVAANQRVRESYFGISDRLAKGVVAGVEQGYILPAMGRRFRDAFDRIAVTVVDPAVSERGALGAYYRQNHSARVAADVAGADLPTVLGHELFGHGAGGGAFEQNKLGEIARRRVGFEEQHGESEWHVALNEVVAHHLILGCVDEGHDFATIDPDERAERGSYEDGGYYARRKVLAALVKRSDEIVDFKNITRGIGEDSDEFAKETEYRRWMVTESRTAYGAGAYRDLDVLMRAADKISPDAPDAAERLQALTGRIHGPTRAADGTVRPGHIDIEGLRVASSGSSDSK